VSRQTSSSRVEVPPLPRWAMSVTVFVLVTAALIFVAWAKMQTVQITYKIDDLIDQESWLAAEQRRLRTELAELRSPRHLETLAPELGLVPPKPGQLVVVGDESVEVTYEPGEMTGGEETP